MVDALRGLAVLAMFEWHSADAWLDEVVRPTSPFVAARAIGGLAAPTFLLLAGVSLGLATPLEPSPAHTAASVRRALRVVLAGYALSLFAWVVDRGAVLEARNLGTALATALAIGVGARAVDDRVRTLGERLALGVSAAGAAALAAQGIDACTRAATTVVPRLDVLHGIGAALAVTALALHATRTMATPSRALALGTAGVLVAACGVSMAGAPQRALPSWIAAWIARGASGGGGFPFFPWLAYTLVGAALALAVRARPVALEHRWSLPFVRRPALVALVAIGVATITWDYSPIAHATTGGLDAIRSLVRLVANASIALAAASCIAAIAPRATRIADALALLGRHSLVLYAVHLELAYGLVGLPLRRDLGLGGWGAWLVVLVVAMHTLAREIERRECERRERAPAS